MKIKKYSEVNQVLAKLYTKHGRWWRPQNTGKTPAAPSLWEAKLPIWVPGSRSWLAIGRLFARRRLLHLKGESAHGSQARWE